LLRFYNPVSRGTMLITFVQGIVRAFHEHFSPFYQAGGQKRRDHANDDFLGKSGVHGPIEQHARCHWRLS
jgi:hypothetical protein